MMEQMGKKILLISAVLFALGFVKPAHAANCSFGKETAELQTLKSGEDVDKELTLRKNILYGILDCLSTSTEKLKSNYDSLPFVQAAQNLRTRFLDEIKGNNFFYAEKRKELNMANLSDTKSIAKELLTWKKNHENNLLAASYFTLWAGSQDFLKRAEDRLAQINGLILKQNDQNNLGKAKNSLSLSESLNISAQESFERSVPPDDSLALIKQSLEKMYDSYRYFIKISDSQN